MKTKKEVKAWFLNQAWFYAFEENLREYYPTDFDDYINDMDSEGTLFIAIKEAFLWDDTKEGLAFWKEVDKKYCFWFNHDFYDEPSQAPLKTWTTHINYVD